MPDGAQQVHEAYLLWSSMRPDEFAWRPNAPGDEDKWQVALEQAESGTEEIAAVDELPPLALSLRVAEPLWLNVNYAADCGGDAKLTLHGPAVPAETLRDLQGKLERAAQEAKEQEQEYIVFAAFTELQAHVADRQLLEEGSKDSNSTSQPSARADEPQPVITTIDHVEMLRVIFWTHHLKAPSKKRDMTHWCAELSIFGLVKSGYPGFLCFEGASDAVREIVRRIKALQWHAITVKTEVPYTHKLTNAQIVAKANEDALSHCLLAKGHSAMTAHDALASKNKTDHGVKLRTTMDEVQTSRELVERLRDAGIPEDEMKYALNLRS